MKWIFWFVSLVVFFCDYVSHTPGPKCPKGKCSDNKITATRVLDYVKKSFLVNKKIRVRELNLGSQT
jgi:hypothetical protein